MLRDLTIDEIQLVGGGLTDDPGDPGDQPDDFAGTELDVSSGMDSDYDGPSMEFSQDSDGEIVVIAEKNMPAGWSDSSWAQIGCKLAGTMAGQNDFESDLICHVDWSGDNPADPKNANRLGEIMRNHSDEIFNAVEKVQAGVDASIKIGS